MALTPTIINDRVIIRLNPSTGAAQAAAVEQLLRVHDSDTGKDTDQFLPVLPVTANGPLSLPALLTAAQAATFAANGDLGAQVTALTADLAAANATIAQQAAEIKRLNDIINPHPSISTKAVQQAIDKLQLSDFWQKALATVKPEDAKAWYSADQINFQEDYWLALDAAMTDMGAWKDHGAALIALAQQFAAG